MEDLRAENERLKRELRRYKEEVGHEISRAANAVLAIAVHAESTVEDEMARRALRDKEEEHAKAK